MKRIAGAALAAVMACGWAGAAEASPIEFSGFGPANTSAKFDFTFDDRAGQGTGFVSLLNSGSTDTYTTTNLTYTVEYFTYGNLERTSDTSFNLAYGAAFDTQYGTIYVASFSIEVDAGTEYRDVTGDGGLNIRNTSITHDGSGLYYGPVEVRGNLFAPVPLPTSAPLFGAALLTLGGLGYASRRHAQATPPARR